MVLIWVVLMVLNLGLIVLFLFGLKVWKVVFVLCMVWLLIRVRF